MIIITTNNNILRIKLFITRVYQPVKKLKKSGVCVFLTK